MEQPAVRKKPIYKKPLFWIILAAALVCIALLVCVLAMPKKPGAEPNVAPNAGAAGDNSEAPNWDEAKEFRLDAFPDVVFRRSAGAVEAVENDTARTLLTGMPVQNVFPADVTGDGKPELCATVLFGSGMIDEHVVVYDYANRQSYTLWERGSFDFHLYDVDGAIYVGKTPYMGDKQVDSGTLTMHDGVLCCRWQSDGSDTPLNRELHESELIGEWIVEQETDHDGNVLYTQSIDLWKEYSFRADGTVIYNEMVPISSDSELAFGHPKSFPFEVHDNYVYIAPDSADGSFRWGSYQRDTDSIELMYHTDEQTVYVTLRRMGKDD